MLLDYYLIFLPFYILVIYALYTARDVLQYILASWPLGYDKPLSPNSTQETSVAPQAYGAYELA